MKFGEPSPCSVDTANRFMVERVKKAPPPRGDRVKVFWAPWEILGYLGNFGFHWKFWVP